MEVHIMSQACCGPNLCSWFNQHFSLEIAETQQGLDLKLTTKDASKAQALQNLASSVKAFCKAFCPTC